MAALLLALVAMFLSPRVLILLTLSIAKALKTRLLEFCGRRQQDAPETFPSQPPKRRVCRCAMEHLLCADGRLLLRCGAGRGTHPIFARTASADGGHPEGRNGARNERSGAPAKRVDRRPRERYTHAKGAAPGDGPARCQAGSPGRWVTARRR